MLTKMDRFAICLIAYAHSDPRCALCTTRLHKLVIRTMDTDVVVLAIGYFPALRLDELWVRFGVGTHFRQIAIQEIVTNVNKKA